MTLSIKKKGCIKLIHSPLDSAGQIWLDGWMSGEMDLMTGLVACFWLVLDGRMQNMPRENYLKIKLNANISCKYCTYVILYYVIVIYIYFILFL